MLPCLAVQGGILSIDAAPGSESLVASAGADGVVVLFDHGAGRIKASLNGHSKKVNGAGCPRPSTHSARMQRTHVLCMRPVASMIAVMSWLQHPVDTDERWSPCRRHIPSVGARFGMSSAGTGGPAEVLGKAILLLES